MDYNLLYYAAGTSLGGLAGFIYYKFVGCKTGVCFITANPYSSSLMGAVLAYLVTGNFIH